MSQEAQVYNPFMLMLDPEVVLAAVERSEKLRRLNRRMCHPLDKPVPTAAGEAGGSGQTTEPGGLN
jgi:hypothetical protein